MLHNGPLTNLNINVKYDDLVSKLDRIWIKKIYFDGCFDVCVSSFYTSFLDSILLFPFMVDGRLWWTPSAYTGKNRE